MTKKITKPAISVPASAALLVKANTFKASTVLSNKEFSDLAKSINPNLFTKKRTKADRAKSTLALVRTQGTINEKLRPRGMVLKSRDYYSEFYIVKNVKAEAEVVRYVHMEENARERNFVLSTGIVSAKRKKK